MTGPLRSKNFSFRDFCRERSRRLISRKGFTLIEMLVVIAITAVIASYMIVYSRQSGRQIALYVETQKLAELIFKAKSIAFAAYRDPTAAFLAGHNLACGYGLKINYAANQYSLFSYDPPSFNPDGRPACVGIMSIKPGLVNEFSDQKYNLNPGLTFQNPGDGLTYVLFVPPGPTTIVSTDPDGSPSANGDGKIYLQVVGGAAQITITVNSGGQIDF